MERKDFSCRQEHENGDPETENLTLPLHSVNGRDVWSQQKKTPPTTFSQNEHTERAYQLTIFISLFGNHFE